MANRHLRRRYHNSRRSWRKIRSSAWFKLLIWVLVLAAVAALVLFVVLPIFNIHVFGKESDIKTAAYRAPLYGEKGNQTENDLSSLQQEARIDNNYRSINDAYMDGDEIVFSTATVTKNVRRYNKLVIFNTKTEEHEVLDVKVKYDNIVWSKLSGDYVVWIDSNQDGGGRIMMYDRKTGKEALIKEYAYALPQISVYGEYLAFWQQAGTELDRIYLVNLKTREAVTVQVMEELPDVTGAVQLSDVGLTYSVPYVENDITKCRIMVQSPTTGLMEVFEPGRFAYAPKSSGIYTAFLSSSTGAPTDLYLMDRTEGKASLLIKSVTNFGMGDGFVTYTKDNAIYAYRFIDKQTYRLSTTVSRGLLAGTNGQNVFWYDITGGGSDVDVVKYAKVVFE